MSQNQAILARMLALCAIDDACRGPQLSPFDQLMAALEDAISDARDRRDSLVAAGDAGNHAYLKINDQIACWESARRNNR